MKKSTKIVAKTATEVAAKSELPKELPIGVAEMGRIQLKSGKSILVAKTFKSFNWKKSEKETVRFDLKTGKSKNESLTVEVKTYKRDDAATMKALEAHRAMKLAAQQRYLAKKK